jgi:rRNA maturation endonuclease Nob1
MRRIILDSGVIITDPSSGSFIAPDTKFIVPEPVANDLLRTAPGATYSSLVGEMVKSGNTVVASASTTPSSVLWSNTNSSTGLSIADRAVLTIADEARRENPNDDIFIATEDQAIRRTAPQLGVKVLSAAELKDLLKESPRAQPVQEQANRVRAYERRHLYLSGLVGVVVSACAIAGFQNRDVILATAHVWSTLILIPVTGLALFWLRANLRLSYGLSEFFVGCYAALNVFLPSFAMPESGSAIIQLFGGLYILVRGLDNIGAGLRNRPLGVRWERWFPHEP